MKWLRALALTASLVAAIGSPAFAALAPGATAPDFTAEATLGGKAYAFDLRDALAKGPVVLYFYPAAFTSGCTLEAHDFAAAIPRFEKLGATVIAVSGDDVEKLKRFSVSECRSAFPVASDKSHAISREYDALLGFGPVAFSNRTSYVIAPDGKIAYAYTAMDPRDHVANALAAVEKLRK